MLQPDGSWESLGTLGLPNTPLPGPIATTLSVIIPPGLTGELTLRLLASNSRIVAEFAERPTPHPPETPLWPIPSNNGGLTAAAVRTLIVQAALGLGPITTDVKIFSPNSDSIVDVVRIHGEALEAATLTVRVLRRGSSSLVRTIVSELPTSVGLFEFVWDGLNDSGLVVEDGEYAVEVEAVNGCGGISTASVLVEIDNTAPTVAITNLIDDQPISVAVEVIGTATDEHFDNYVLEFGEGASPLSFTSVMPPVMRKVIDRPLGNWSVGDLDAGVYTLRLSAVDVVGNRATAPVRLEVLAADFIERYVVDPALISPNADTVKDQAEIELDLKAEARVTLTILNSASAPMTTLIDGAVLPIGPHTAIWDGLDTPDGDYVAFLRAEHPTASTLFEESEIAITVDTVAPAITIATPAAEGFLSLPGAINGSITDDHLERFQIEVGPTATALTSVAEDTLPASGILATLSSLSDGSYRLRATASDQAGNTTELDFVFEIDSTPPALALTAPIGGTFVARLPGGAPLPVTGSVEEANLVRYDLEFGFGAPPSVFVPLAGGTSAPRDASLATWDLETLPDGHYTLRLSATDQAANFRIVETEVILDTTPPTVVIETPAADAVASEAIGVGGTVNDANFHTGTLGVAPAATPDRVTELASFTSPVTSGVLAESLALVDGEYILELRAEDLAGNVAATTTAFVIDTEPPLPPSGLTATPEARDVTLAWTASPSSDVVGYHLSRDGVRITAEPVPTTSFVDTDLDEGVYRYTALAVDAANLESEPTEPATARIDLTPPNVVLRSPDEGDRVRVEVDVIGTAFSESDFFEYRLSAAPVETPLSPTLLKRSSVPVSFDTLGRWRPLTDGDYILTLEGEDTSGNVAEDSVRVTVDNAAPVAPVLVRAEALAKPDDIEIEWTAPSDTDVDGFLVYRNGQIANAPGAVSGSLRPFLVPGPTYVDAELPDGEHCYRVAAMDIAGNISADSNELCVFLDNREPKALIFDPEDGARFDAARTIRAESPDLDIATVSFEYQLVGDTVWTVISLDTDGEPFETIWDITGIDFGDYLLRAVATDIGTRSDPAPATIGVTLGDVTPPGAPSDLIARVVADMVELSWLGVTDSDLAGYRIFRDDTMVLEPGVAAVSAVDTGVLDGDYVYTVRAVDGDGNESDPSNAAAAHIYAPSLVPAFPVFETAAVDLPGAGASPGATARLFDAGTIDEVAAETADALGGFLYSALSLPLGSNVLEAEATDADANVSRRSREALLIRNEVPVQPTGFVAVASGDDANLSWDPSGEADLSGYLITRDGEVVNTRGLLRPSGPIPTGVTAAASVNESAAPGVIGSGLWSMGSDEEQWIELTLAEPRHLDQIRLLWIANRAAKDYDLLIELEGRLAPIVRVRDQAPTFLSEHTLPIPVRTSRVRLHIFSSATRFGILLDELELIGVLPETTTAFTDSPPAPGVYDYAVEAIDTLGGRGPAAGPIAVGVGDLTPPAAPTLTATVDEERVLLSWPVIADAVRYRLFRDDVPLRDATSTFVIDNNLLNATYAYHLIALDVAGNESGPSNVEIVTVDVARPPAPVLNVTSLTIGRALSLSWTESIGPLGVPSYVIARSTTMGGPYAEIASVGGSTFAYLDSGLDGGVEYFYVVHAVDFRGEASDLSNEAAGIPTDTVAPPTPVWISPESPLTVTASRIDLIGAAEPATTVEVFRDDVSIGTAPVSDEFRPIAEPFLRSTSNISVRFALSLDRNVVAEVSSRFSTDEVRLYDLRTGAVRTVAYQEDGSFERGVSFSPNGRYLAVATTGGSPSNRAIRILDLETETTEVLALIEAPEAPAFVSDDELAVVVGDDIRIFDLTLDSERTLYTSTSFSSPENLTASTDGAYLAWNERGELYVMPVTGGAPELVFNSFRLDEFEWAGARTLVFEASGLGLHFYDVDTLSTVLVPDTEELRFPTSLGIDGAVSAIDGSALYWVFADATVMELGEPSADFNRQFFAWSSDLLFAGTTFGSTLALVETPGRFVLEARLESGLNVLIARSTDEAGHVSPDSDALELTYDNSSLADLTFDADITIVPLVPLTGDSASISIPIVNAGASPSPESSVSVTGTELSGTLYTVGAATIPALDAGASTKVVLPWSTAGRLGPQSVQAVVDPLELIDELDETNNTAGVATTVVGTAGLELTITSGRPRYAAGQVAELSVSAVNGGGAFDGIFETRIEHTTGVVVALVDSRPSSLAYAASTRYSSFWTTGSIASGTYVARVRALSGSGVVATATASFELTRTLDITLNVIPERPFYEQGDLVRLLARVANAGSNTPLRDLSLRYRIVDPSAVTVFDSTVPLGYLAIGGAVSSSSAWKSGVDELGTYTVSVDAFEGTDLVLVASVVSSFEMTAASTIALTGALTLASDAVPSGSEVMASYTIENESVIELTSGTVRVELFDAATDTTVASAESSLTVAGRDTVSGELRLDTTGLELGRYSVVLSAGGATSSSLATAPVTLFATPAAPSLNAPADGATAAQRLLLSVNNATNPNDDTLAYEFEIYLDSSLTVRLGAASGLSEGTTTTAWSVLTFLEENRFYYWRARARDRFATSGWMVPATVFVDSGNEAPDAPVLSAPADTTEVDVLRPTLVVGNATDPENDVLIYTFELYLDEGLTELALATAGIPETSATTSFTPTDDLIEDATYFWRARANDGSLDGEWMAVATFRVNTANHAPNAPTPVEPIGGSVATLTPELVVTSAIDPEGDPITHTFQIDVTDSFDSPARQESLPLDNVRFTPPAPLGENAVYFWRARAADAVSAGPWSTVATFRVDVANEPPEAPTPQRPADGAVVASATPVLAVVNALDPENDPLTYTLEVYEEDLTTLVASVTALPEGETETAWAVSPRLAEETTYFWIARANDGEADGPASATQRFRVNVMNEQPSAPALLLPAEGSNVSDLAPTLVVGNATDPDGDPLTYLFEIYEDELLDVLIESSGEIGEGVAETSWTMSEALVENHLYYWRVRAFDSRLEGAWMATARFRFSLTNEPPTSPMALEPSDLAVVTETQPTLVIAPSTDPEQDALTYTYHVFRDAALTLADLVVSSPATDETSWLVSLPLDENETFYWHAIASDGDLESVPSVPFSFTVNAVDEPPTIPVLSSPADGAVITTTTPTLTVDNATSPDGIVGEPLVYHFALYADAALTDVVAEDAAVAEGTGTTSWDPPVTLTPGAMYYWNARAIDTRGLLSGLAPAFSFTVEPPVDACPPEWRDDFERYPRRTSLSGWQLDKESGKPRFRVKKRNGSKRLLSSGAGRGSLLYVGTPGTPGTIEAFGWRNYELDGELWNRHRGSDDDSDDDSSDDDSSDDDSGGRHRRACDFAVGVAFYAKPAEGEAYRLELTGPQCGRPQARIVKLASGKRYELARVRLDRHYTKDRLRFEIETINGSGVTSIRVRLTGRVKSSSGKEREWALDVDDTSSPLRGGTVGAWADFARAEWDNLHVREVEGFSSGISGDADGDGVCDVDVDIDTGSSSVPLHGVKKKTQHLSVQGNHHGPLLAAIRAWFGFVEVDRLEHIGR